MNAVQLLSRQPWVEHLGWTLLHFLWQGAAIALLFGTARAVWNRRLTAQSRYLLACLALAAMVAAPLVTFTLTEVAPMPTIAQNAALDGGRPLVIPAAGAGAAAWSRGALPWMVLIWLAGAAAFSVRLAGGWMFAARLRTVAVRPAPWEWQIAFDRLLARLGMTQTVHLLVSSLVQVPTVVGWLRPVVLVPVGALAGLPTDHLEALLAHELAHVLRRDYLANLLQSVAEALLFYHPAVWWMSQQIRLERELCCDDLAVEASGDVLVYARALAELESYRPGHVRAALAANGGSLPARIGRLLGQSHSAPPIGPRPGAALAASLLILAAGAMAIRGDQNITPVPDQHGITVDTSGSRVIHRTPVAYPGPAIEKRVEGTVVAEVTLDGQGDAADARIVSGPDELRKAVLQSVLQWHFASDSADRLRQVRITFQLAGAQTPSAEMLTGLIEEQQKSEMARLVEVQQQLELARRQAESDGNRLRSGDYLSEQKKAEAEVLRQHALGMRDQLAEQEKYVELSRQYLESAQAASPSMQALQDQLRQKYAEQTRQYLESAQAASPSTDAVQDQLRRLEELRGLAAADMADTDQQHMAQVQEELARLAALSDESRLMNLKNESNLDMARQAAGNLPGRLLDGVEFRGMPDDAANTLFAKIPVHRGGLLTPEAIERIRRAVTEFDPHLVMTISPTDNNGAVVRIAPPGTRFTPDPK